MATIGLDKLYYANIEEDELGNETYDEPRVLAKAMTADLTVELNEAVLYADDGAAEVVKESFVVFNHFSTRKHKKKEVNIFIKNENALYC